MSKKKKKNNKRNKKSNVIAFPKQKAKRISLKEKLRQIYNTVDLSTTCEGRCECCKIAMPQMNYSEFCQILTELWQGEKKEAKLEYLCMSMEYYFRHDYKKWGMDTLVKPCLLLDEEGKCKYYESRPLSCRMYGLWPEEEYNARVDKFEKAYDGILTREELPLNKQCPYVKRTNESVELTTEIIDDLYKRIDGLDQRIANFTDLQIDQKENYRTFHDWMLWTFIGEDNLAALTRFMLGANKAVMEDQLKQFREVWTKSFEDGFPNPKIVKELKDYQEDENGDSSQEGS